MKIRCGQPHTWYGGSAPATPGFNAVAPEWRYGAADAAPAIPAAESTLGSHPCVALSSAQVPPEWTTSTPPCNDFSANGGNPLTLCLSPGVHSSPYGRTPQAPLGFSAFFFQSGWSCSAGHPRLPYNGGA